MEEKVRIPQATKEGFIECEVGICYHAVRQGCRTEKKWVIDISTIEELSKLSKFAAFHYGAHSHREALIIYRDDECDLPIIEFYNDYHE